MNRKFANAIVSLPHMVPVFWWVFFSGNEFFLPLVFAIRIPRFDDFGGILTCFEWQKSKKWCGIFLILKIDFKWFLKPPEFRTSELRPCPLHGRQYSFLLNVQYVAKCQSINQSVHHPSIDSINQSIDQSNRRLKDYQSTNQPITYYWFFLLVLTNQSINRSINQDASPVIF